MQRLGRVEEREALMLRSRLFSPKGVGIQSFRAERSSSCRGAVSGEVLERPERGTADCLTAS